MKSAGKARNNGLYRHIRTSKEIIRNLLNDYKKKQNNQTTTSNFPCNFNFTVSNMNRFNQGIDHG